MMILIINLSHSILQLIELLGDQNELAASDVLIFVREAVQRFEQLRPVIINKLLDTFSSIKSLKWVEDSRYQCCKNYHILLSKSKINTSKIYLQK